MRSDGWRLLRTGAALAFLVWHGSAIAIGPLPDSELSHRLRPLVEPYLRIGYLDHAWTFFGPRPDPGRIVRYELILSDGTTREYPLSDAIGRDNPNWFRWMRLFDNVANGDPELQRGAATYLCRQHVHLDPRAIRFVVLHQLTLSPALYRAGVRPIDREALRRAPGDDWQCASIPAQRPG